MGATIVLAAAAVAPLFFVESPPRPSAEAEFAARRAGTPPSLARDVGVSLFTGTARLRELDDGATVAKDAPFTAVYTNVHAAPVTLLVFAEDAQGAIHWLYPAYLVATDDPASVPLARAERPRPLPTSVVLDDPAEGPLRVVALVTEEPLHVSDIEHRGARERSRAELARAFPLASITEFHLHVGAGSSP